MNTVPKPYAMRTAEALERGMTPKRLRGPRVAHPHHGVVSSRPAISLEDRCRAYLAVRPAGAFFSGLTAAALHGLPIADADQRLHVSVPAPGRAPRGRGIAGHSVRLSPGDVVELRGLPLSSPERTWCELATALGVEDLVVVGDAILGRSRDARGLADAVRRSAARRGRTALAAALAALDAGAESPQESRLRYRLAAAGIDGFQANQPIVTAAGLRYRGDLVFPARRLILEYQGDHHRERTQYRRDLSRRLDLQADGWRVVELGPADLDDPGLVRRVRALLALGPIRAGP